MLFHLLAPGLYSLDGVTTLLILTNPLFELGLYCVIPLYAANQYALPDIEYIDAIVLFIRPSHISNEPQVSPSNTATPPPYVAAHILS